MSGQNCTGQVRNERLQRFLKSVLVSITFIVALNLTATRLQASTVNISAGDNIPSIVSSNPPGTTFVIHAGTYRLLAGHIVAKSGDVFTGQPGAILSGAKRLRSLPSLGELLLRHRADAKRTGYHPGQQLRGRFSRVYLP